MSPSNLRRAVLVTLLAAASSLAARAADPAPPVVAVLSLIGDEFEIVVRRPSVGSRTDQNDRQPVPVDEAMLDDAAATAAERALKQAMPGSEHLRASIRDKRLYALQDALLAPGPESDGVRDALQAMLKKEGATQLLLVTKRRDDARFNLAHGSTGAGKVNGVGIYLDNTIRLRNTNTSDRGTGYYASFAYVKVTMVDIATMRATGSRDGSDSVMNTSTGVKDVMSAWDTLTAEQKVRRLVHVIDRAVYTSTRELASAH